MAEKENLLVLITVSHKNTPNTRCPVLGVHITSAAFLIDGSLQKVIGLHESLKSTDFSRNTSETRPI